MIRITYEFDTEDQALQFLARDKAQPVQLNLTAEARPRGRPPKQNAVAAVQAETPAPQTAHPVVAATAPKTAVTGVPPVVAPVGTPASQVPVAAVPKVANQPVQAVQTVTQDNVRTALREVFNTKGATVATAILSQFKAARVSDIKPEQFADFIKACQA